MRMLNTGKGPAVRALRAQADKWQYHEHMKDTIENTPNLTLRQAIVDEVVVEDGVCKGVITNTGAKYHAKSVVLTTGTAARGKSLLVNLLIHQDLTTLLLQLSCLRIWKSLVLSFVVSRPVRLHVLTAILLIIPRPKKNLATRLHVTSHLKPRMPIIYNTKFLAG